MYQFGPFIRTMMTHNPQHFMDQAQIAKVQKKYVYTDIPIPMNPEEEFDTDVLVEWYEEQKKKGLLE